MQYNKGKVGIKTSSNLTTAKKVVNDYNSIVWGL